MAILSIDIETYSDVDLSKCGVYAYSDSPNFEILLFAYAFDEEPTQSVDLAGGVRLPERVLAADFLLLDGSVRPSSLPCLHFHCLWTAWARYWISRGKS